jgi:hypothetical protein
MVAVVIEHDTKAQSRRTVMKIPSKYEESGSFLVQIMSHKNRKNRLAKNVSPDVGWHAEG